MRRLAAVALLLLCACEPARPTRPAEVEVVPAEVLLHVGDTVTLQLRAADQSVITEDVMWSVDDPSVAVISHRGLLSGVGIGKTVARGSLGTAVGTASVVVGPLMLGSWQGESDTVALYFRFNASSTPNGFTGLGSVSLGAAPGIYSVAWGSAFRDSVRFTGGGQGISFDYAGRFVNADEIHGTFWLNQTAEHALDLSRIGP